MGEHGDSEFVPWSQAFIATKPVVRICEESGGKFCLSELQKISDEVKSAGEKIIEAKKSTYYGIGMAMVRLTKAIFGDENSVLTLSAMLDGEYGRANVYAGVPAVVSRSGVDRVLTLSLTDQENAALRSSCDLLEKAYGSISF
jgi:L-lactate dehydrogenase